jgi:antitoxin component YwqK of YwqJK toxin-antitoxin module
MKIKIIALLPLTLIFLSSCQKKGNDSEIVSQRYVHKYGFEVSEKEWQSRDQNGEVIATLKNGVIKSTSYKNGQLDGPQTLTFSHSKVIQEKSDYDEGRLIKKVIYEPTGLPIQEFVYDIDGNKTVTIWDKNGVPLSMEEYSNELLWSARYYNNQNEIEGSIVDGKGTRIKRNRDGLLLSQEMVENGKIISRKAFHPNGGVQSQSSFLDYQLHGKQETFSPSGKLITSVNWDHGKMNGLMTCYRDNQIIIEIPYKDGMKHGIEKEYNQSGAVVKEIHWENDKKHGTSRSYFDDYTDIQWYWKGMAVDLHKFHELELREELTAQIHPRKGFKIEKTADPELVESSVE